ncbi:MAG: right-handed parallel beta-helix repeat-containing protein [Verrucomicrobia bacterium]|nr:right-handed parallel beta-helix repeat-containing protein [Verrucomicrobiota bacterium]
MIRFISRATLLYYLAPVVVIPTSAKTYYADNQIGRDDRSGTQPDEPWKNCPGMAEFSGSATLAPGDKVYFKAGKTWRVTGSQGIYLVGGVTYVGNAWGASTERARLQAAADLDAGLVRFRDHPTIPTLFQGFEIDGNGHVTTGVDINHRHWSKMQGASKQVVDCEIHHIFSRESANQYKYGIIVSNHGGLAGLTENVQILGCKVHDVSRDALCIYPGDEDANCRVSKVLVRGCEVFNTGQDPDYQAGAGLLIKGYVQDAHLEYNYVHDTKGAAIFVNGNESRHYNTGPIDIHISYNLVTGSTGHGGIRIYDGRSGKDPKKIRVYGNLIFKCLGGPGLYLSNDLGNRLDLAVYNNTFFEAPVFIHCPQAQVDLLEFRNNIVVANKGVPLTDDFGQITKHTDNLYFSKTGVAVVSGGNAFKSAQITTEFESTALSIDPQFQDVSDLPTGFSQSKAGFLAPNQAGLSLQRKSRARNYGAPLGREFKGSINSVERPANSLWDLGAYQTEGEQH